jgi:hypothetical protein
LGDEGVASEAEESPFLALGHIRAVAVQPQMEGTFVSIPFCILVEDFLTVEDVCCLPLFVGRAIGVGKATAIGEKVVIIAAIAFHDYCS